MDDKGRPLVEAIHAEARARLAGETLPRSEVGTIHYTELPKPPPVMRSFTNGTPTV